jgi:hypothetical protein
MSGVFERYTRVTEGKWPTDDPKVKAWDRDRLKRLIKTLGSDASIPLILGLSYGPRDRLISTVLFLERFVFRYNLSGGHKSSFGDRLFDEAKLGREDPSWSVKDLEKALAPLASKYAGDGRFEAALLGLRYRGSRNQVAHLLTTLDDYYPWYARGAAGTPKPSRAAVFLIDSADVDHIYPRSPETGNEDVALDPVRDYLGNLAFLDLADNRSMKNAPFARKQADVYKTAKAQLTKVLADKKATPTWSLKSYEARRDYLLKMALEVFRVATA